MEKISRNALMGVIFVLVGVAYLMSNLGIVPDFLKDIIFSWQALIILFGLGALSRGRYTAGLVLVGIGGIYMLSDILEMFHLNFFEPLYDVVLWPSVIIFFGLWLIFHKKRVGRYNCYGDSHTREE